MTIETKAISIPDVQYKCLNPHCCITFHPDDEGAMGAIKPGEDVVKCPKCDGKRVERI